MTQPPQDRPDYPWGPSTGSTPPVPPAEGETTQLPRPDLTKATPTSGGSSAWQPPAETPSWSSAPQRPAAQDAAFASTPDPDRDRPRTDQPYAGQPPAGQPAGQGGTAPQGYVQQGYASGYAGRPAEHGGGPAGGGVPTSTIVLLVVSGLLLLLTFWSGIGLVWAAPAVLAVVAMTRAGRDLAAAKRLTRIGWWVTIGLGVITLLLVVAAIVFFGFLFSSSTYDGYGSYDDGSGAGFSGLTTSAAYLRALVA